MTDDKRMSEEQHANFVERYEGDSLTEMDAYALAPLLFTERTAYAELEARHERLLAAAEGVERLGMPCRVPNGYERIAKDAYAEFRAAIEEAKATTPKEERNA